MPSASDVEREIQQLVGTSEFAPKRRNGPLALRQAPAEHEFVKLADQCGDGLVAAAEGLQAQVQEKLEECKRMRDETREQYRQKSKEIAELMTRLKTFGERVLDAHKELNAATSQDENAP